jgi:RHS repeat-associated protein
MLTKAQTTQESIYYYHTDHLGTPIMLTDANQAVAWDATYEPFGKASITTASVTNNLRFPGQYYDMETGLHYNWHRYYWPETGRYVSVEPALQPLLFENIYFNIPKSFIPIFPEYNFPETTQIVNFMSKPLPRYLWVAPYMVDEPQNFQSFSYSLNNPVTYYDQFAMLWLCKLDHSETNCWKDACGKEKCERHCVYLCRRGVTSGPVDSYYLKWTTFLPCPPYWAH